MKTRLLGAAVLLLLLVIFVPMFFASKPPTAAGDQSVSLAIPPAPDRDLQTKTMSLAPNAPAAAGTVASSNGTAVSADHLATVDIGSRRPQDVGTDAAAGTQPSVVTGSGDSASQPVIPMQGQSSSRAPAPTSTPAVPVKTRSEPVAAQPKASPSVATRQPAQLPAAAPAEAPAAGHGSYTLNLSAYASASGAAHLVRRVHALGYPARGHVITQAGQQRTLVIAGPFETRTAAEAARLKITQSIPGAPARLQQDAEQASSTAPVSTSADSSSRKPGGYAVQLVAVSNKADAEALRSKLRANGFDGFVDSVQSGGKRLWRVRAGPQTQRADAQRIQGQIKAKLGINGVVVSVP